MPLFVLCVFANAEWCTVSAEQYKVTLETYVLVSSISCGPNKMDKLLTQHGFPCKSSRHFSKQTYFLFWDIASSARSPDLAVTEYFFRGYVKSEVCGKKSPANTS